MRRMYAVVSVLAAAVLALSFGVPLALGTWNHSNAVQQDEDQEPNTSATESVASGAGWFNVGNTTSVVRDFFAFELQSNQSKLADDFLMFKATDIGKLVVSVNFTKVTIVNKTAEAWGWAKVGDVSGYWFDLKASDGGLRSNDMLDLKVYNDTNKNWMMDETTPTYNWTANGLSGGNIVITAVAPHHEHEDEDEEESHERVNITAAAGGGWFMGSNGTTPFKITFGMFVTDNKTFMNDSRLVLQGRNVSERIQSVNFTKIEITNKTLEAWGWCRANGMPGYWFHLTATDGGNRSKDMLSLEVFKDTNGNHLMDETTPTWHWVANGLGGGDITVGIVSIELDHECAEDHESDEDHDDSGEHDSDD